MDCWKKPSSLSLSTRLLVPFLVVSLLVVIFRVNSDSGSYYYPWSWYGSVFPGEEQTHYSTSSSDLELRRRVVDDGGGEREAAFGLFLNRSAVAATPVVVGVREVVVGPQATEEEKKKNETSVSSQNSGANNSSEIQHLVNSTMAPAPSSPVILKTFSKLQILESKLQQARASIRESQMNGIRTHDPDYMPTGPMYLNAAAFHRSYLEMEKQFKMYVYEEGEHPIFHNGPCGSIYSMEGNFIYKLETSNFRTRDPEKAHVYFLPFSVTSIVHFIYNRSSQDHWLPMKQTVKDYVDLVAGKYPYWNRSLGADHLMLSCHDWGPEISKSVPELFKNSIRALCNANTTEGFRPSKDVSIPEINLPGGRTNGLVGGPSPSKRPILVFFAGGLHGPIRPILLDHWENKDEDVQVHKYLPKGVSYPAMMRKSKYCICPSGYEVASPRMVEALYTGCVPVLIKDHYVPPFSDVLNWKSFAVEIPVEEIPNLKKILRGISTRQYIRMQRRGVQVRRHFEVNSPPKRYDVFHMTLHSIWLRRLNVRLHGVDNS